MLLAAGLIIVEYSHSASISAPSDAAVRELGPVVIGMMQHSTHVETFAVHTIAPGSRNARHLLADQEIVAVGSIHGADYARQLCSIFFNEGDYPDEVASSYFHPIFGVRMHSADGTVEIATDAGTHRSHLCAFDNTGDQIRSAWIEDIVDVDGFTRLARAAAPMRLLK